MLFTYQSNIVIIYILRWMEVLFFILNFLVSLIFIIYDLIIIFLLMGLILLLFLLRFHDRFNKIENNNDINK